MRKSALLVSAVLVAAAVPLVLLIGSAGTSGSSLGTGNNVLARALAIQKGLVKPTRLDKKLPSVSGGVVTAALEFTGYFDRRADRGAKPASAAGLLTQSKSTTGCQKVFGPTAAIPNVRVNQDCSLRRQAEEVVAVNPKNASNLIAGQNDNRIGFNHCGYDWTTDKGKTWGDQVPPFWQYIMGDGETADACSDPTATFDAGGNAYIGGILFDINYAASAIVVQKSNAGINGAFFHSPDSSAAFQTYRDDPPGVIASDNDPNIFNDKEFIVADATNGSKKNNVYATWTRFNGNTAAGVGLDSPIYFSQSTDGGAHWSTGVEISGAGSMCTDFSGESNPNACDQDQGSNPFVGPNGAIYVVFTNGNTPELGHNQQLFVKCPVSADCSSASSWSAPAKVGDVFDTMPYGNAATEDTTGCETGRQCIPPNGFRVTSFTSASISVDSSGRIYVTWFDSPNLAPNCNPNGSAETAGPPCDTDVEYAYSTDGGATWSATKNVTPASSEGRTAGGGAAQWQPWSMVARNGAALYVGYYDRRYGSCETTGCNDITMATISKPATSSPAISYRRVTSGSMPNMNVATNPLQAGFLGDYMWLATDASGNPKLVWADTRPLRGKAPEEDIYFAAPPVKCVVPKVKGKALSAARVALLQAGCRVGTVTRAYSSLEKGRVISTIPAAGKTGKLGTKVSLEVSKGKKPKQR